MTLFSGDGKSLESTTLLRNAAAVLEREPRRVLNAVSLAFLAYLAVSAGPFGIESAVRAAGPLPVLVAILVLPFVWGLPQALMTAELSTMMDENGGYILWVKRGLGDFAGFMNAFNSMACNLCDLPTYPVLFSAYLQSSWLPDLTFLQAWLLRCASLAVIVALNLSGMGTVSISSALMTLSILGPFLLEPIVASGQLAPSNWLGVAPSVDFSTFVSTLLWNYQGWDSLGCVAGEVSEGGVSYPVGILMAMTLITATYLLPVAVGSSLAPDPAQWVDGFLGTLACRIAPWLGTWVLAAASISSLGEFNVVMSTSSRALWSMSRFHMLPPWLGKLYFRSAVPAPAILLQSVVCALLMTLDFSTLVVLDTLFNNISLLLEVGAFVRLRFVEPDAPRPYRIPGGPFGMWLATVPKVFVLAGSLALMQWRAWAICGSCNLLFALAYPIWRKRNPVLPDTTRSRVSSVREHVRSFSNDEWASSSQHRMDPDQNGGLSGGPIHVFYPSHVPPTISEEQEGGETPFT